MPAVTPLARRLCVVRLFLCGPSACAWLSPHVAAAFRRRVGPGVVFDGHRWVRVERADEAVVVQAG